MNPKISERQAFFVVFPVLVRELRQREFVHHCPTKNGDLRSKISVQM
jgi:hypothetical protein